MIKAVLFDFGGVLTEGGKQGFTAQVIADLYDVPLEQVDIADEHFMLRRGKYTDDMFFAELNRRYHKKVTKEMFLAHADVLGTQASAEVYDLARRLRAQGIKTGILSNVFAMNAEQLRREGHYDGFDPVVLSYEEGYAKPEAAFYRIAVQKTGVAAPEILFIDDQEKSLPPAQALGMHTILATSPAQIVADVTQLIRRENNLEL